MSFYDLDALDHFKKCHPLVQTYCANPGFRKLFGMNLKRLRFPLLYVIMSKSRGRVHPVGAVSRKKRLYLGARGLE